MSPAPAPAAAPPGLERRVLALVFVTVFLDLVGFGLIIPLLPFYVESMGGTATTVGVLLAMFSLAQFFATPLLGRLSDRVGRRPVILVSLAGNAASMALFALATHLHLLPLLFASRLLAGATAGNLAACQAAIADVTEGSARAAGLGRVGAGIGLGLVLGPVIGSQLHRAGEWAPPLAAAVMAAAAALTVAVLLPETHPRHRAGAPPHAPRSGPRMGLATALTRPGLAQVLGLMFLTFIGMTNTQVSLGLLAQARFGWHERQVGYLFALMGLVTMVLQGGLIGHLARRFRDTTLVAAGVISMGLGMACIGLSSRPVLLVVAMVFIGLGTGLVQPMVSSLASLLAGRELQGGVLGVVQSAGGLARVVGPVWSGLLYAQVGPGAPFASGAVAAALCLVLVAALRTKLREAAHLEPESADAGRRQASSGGK